jgi:hypothetical protein
MHLVYSLDPLASAAFVASNSPERTQRGVEEISAPGPVRAAAKTGSSAAPIGCVVAIEHHNGVILDAPSSRLSRLLFGHNGTNQHITIGRRGLPQPLLIYHAKKGKL